MVNAVKKKESIGELNIIAVLVVISKVHVSINARHRTPENLSFFMSLIADKNLFNMKQIINARPMIP